MRARIGTVVATLVLMLPLAGVGPVVSQQQEGDTGADNKQEPSSREQYREWLREAWGPEPPAHLEAYLEIRETLLPIYEQYADGITQWSLREAGTRPMFGPALMGVFRIRRQIDEELKGRPLDFEDYRRLTVLVYGRWLRAVREESPPERSVARALQEIEVGLARQLEHNPPEDSEKRAQVADRLDAVRHHLSFIKHFAFSEEDKKEVLDRIDPQTREWLSAHRERIEAVDFGVFDTAPPSRASEK